MIRRIARWLDPRSAGPEEPDGPRAAPRCRSATPTHHASGRLVGTADGRGHRAGIVHRVRHVGRLSERPLHIRPVPLAVYSPEIFGSSPHAIFGPKPGWWPGWLPFSPALIILPFPGLFRVT